MSIPTCSEHVNRQQIPAMTLDAALGSVGGLLGLMIGASLLSALEVLQLVVHLICFRWMGWTKKGRGGNVDVEGGMKGDE